MASIVFPGLFLQLGFSFTKKETRAKAQVVEPSCRRLFAEINVLKFSREKSPRCAGGGSANNLYR
jgi:hypothetical protein